MNKSELKKQNAQLVGILMAISKLGIEDVPEKYLQSGVNPHVYMLGEIQIITERALIDVARI